MKFQLQSSFTFSDISDEFIMFKRKIHSLIDKIITASFLIKKIMKIYRIGNRHHIGWLKSQMVNSILECFDINDRSLANISFHKTIV